MAKGPNNAHFASAYFDDIDELSEVDNYFVPVLQEVAATVDFKAAHVLDVGCGTGLFLSPVISAGCVNCYGVDGPSEYADRAIRRGYKEVRVVADLCDTPLPFDDDQFDLHGSARMYLSISMDPTYAFG